MAKSMNEFRIKLVDKIIHARSTEGVSRFISAAMRSFHRRRVNGYIVLRFLDRIVVEIQEEPAAALEGQESGNRDFALTRLRSIREGLTTQTSSIQ
jgi:hypothetical protein